VIAHRVIGAATVALAVGCASPMAEATRVSNAAFVAGETEGEVLERECNDRMRVATAADVPAIDARCRTLRDSYRAMRLGRAALLAAITVAEKSGDTTEVVARAADLAHATLMLGKAINAMREQKP